MTDRDFLIWLHERLTNVHKESPLVDYMHRLRAIIADTQITCRSPDSNTNSILDLVRKLEK